MPPRSHGLLRVALAVLAILPAARATEIAIEIATMDFKGETWHLVRRDHDPADGWHPATDNLAGTAEYGSPTTNDLGAATFSVPFGNSFTIYLLASGDRSMWVTIGKAELASRCAASCSACRMTLLGSSMESNPQQHCRSGVPEDPWISAGDYPTHIVYGENSYGCMPAGTSQMTRSTSAGQM